MAVYVDDMYLYPIGQFRNMKMSHLVADTTDELLAMARKIGVNTKWIQYPDTPREHFDIALSKRTLAVQHGAIEITYMQCGAMDARRHATGQLGDPKDAEEWLRTHLAARRQQREGAQP